MIKQITCVAATAAVIAAVPLTGCTKDAKQPVSSSSSIISQQTDMTENNKVNKELTAADIGRSETAMLTFLLEGMEEEEIASLNFGGTWDYSLYLTDEWEDNGPDVWVSSDNPDVHIAIVNHEDMSVSDLIQVLTSDYAFERIDEESDALWWCEEGDVTVVSKIVADGDNTYELQFEYPNEAEEGYGARWMTYFDTFQTFDRNALSAAK